MTSIFRAAGIRAARTFLQTIVGSGIVVGTISATTDWLSVGLTVVNIVVPAAIASLISFLQGVLEGLPEVNY